MKQAERIREFIFNLDSPVKENELVARISVDFSVSEKVASREISAHKTAGYLLEQEGSLILSPSVVKARVEASEENQDNISIVESVKNFFLEQGISKNDKILIGLAKQIRRHMSEIENLKSELKLVKSSSDSSYQEAESFKLQLEAKEKHMQEAEARIKSEYSQAFGKLKEDIEQKEKLLNHYVNEQSLHQRQLDDKDKRIAELIEQLKPVATAQETENKKRSFW